MDKEKKVYKDVTEKLTNRPRKRYNPVRVGRLVVGVTTCSNGKLLIGIHRDPHTPRFIHDVTPKQANGIMARLTSLGFVCRPFVKPILISDCSFYFHSD